MPDDKKDKKPFKFPFGFDIDIQDKDIKVRKILEFVPHTIKPNDMTITRVPDWGGLKNQTFAVLNKDGKEIIIKQLKKSSEKE